MMLLIFSSFSTGNTLTIGSPFDCLLNSGISYPFNLYTLPLLVKKSGTDITEIRKDLEASAKATKDNMEKLVY